MYVALVKRDNARGDPVFKLAICKTLRQRSVRTSTDFRSNVAALIQERTRRLPGMLGVGAIGRVRRHLELERRWMGRGQGDSECVGA